MLQRLVPAMQLLNAARPARLPQTKAIVSDVYGPTQGEVSRRETVGYFVDALHSLDEIPDYGFRVVQVRHSKQKCRDVEVIPDFKLATVSPSRLVRCVLVFGFALTVALVVAAAIWHDGPALIAISLMGLASSLTGYASSWRPLHAYMDTPARRQRRAAQVTKVIGSRRSTMLVIRCSEAVSEELYLGCVDDCWYRARGVQSGVLMAAGSVALMLSVLMLGNCAWKSQLSIAASYVVLNALYWSVSLTAITWHQTSQSDFPDAGHP
jgi:hypothetical protein